MSIISSKRHDLDPHLARVAQQKQLELVLIPTPVHAEPIAQSCRATESADGAFEGSLSSARFSLF